MTATAYQQEALSRALQGHSGVNYAAIVSGFAARGIPVDDIRPRENVFTYQAWRALGRQVRKGEHGVKCLTFIRTDASKRERDRAAQQGKAAPAGHSRPWSTTVFHVSQTDLIADRAQIGSAA